jgi:hypothetical protein
VKNEWFSPRNGILGWMNRYNAISGVVVRVDRDLYRKISRARGSRGLGKTNLYHPSEPCLQQPTIIREMTNFKYPDT